MSLIKNEQDFYWHCKKLNLEHRREFEHCCKPNIFPCIVLSHVESDSNGPDQYWHNFIDVTDFLPLMNELGIEKIKEILEEYNKKSGKK